MNRLMRLRNLAKRPRTGAPARPPARPEPRQRRGFTLTELIVAIGILVVVMAAVSGVFANVTASLRRSLAISAELGTQLDVDSILRRDIESIHPDGFLVIVSMRARAFQDAADRDKAINRDFDAGAGAPRPFDSNPIFRGNPLIFGNPDQAPDPNTGWRNGQADFPAELRADPDYVGKRWYRADLMSFWASGAFRDQAGAESSSGAITLYQHPGVAASEAMITWGHVALATGVDLVDNVTGADNADGNEDVVGLTNNNYFIGEVRPENMPNNLANEWALGRRVLLAPGFPASFAMYRNPVRPFISGINPQGAGASFGPNAFVPSGGLPESFFCSPAGGNAAWANGDVANFSPQAGLTTWSLTDLYARPGYDDFTIAGVADPFGFGFGSTSTNNVTPIKRALNLAYRFPGRLALNTLPPTREDMAKAANVVAPRISDFIVEFAGDYMDQTSTPTAWYTPSLWRAGQDGVIDFIPIANVGTDNSLVQNDLRSPPNGPFKEDVRPNLVRYTVWYGAFRDGNGNGTTFAHYNSPFPVRLNYRPDLAFDVAPATVRIDPSARGERMDERFWGFSGRSAQFSSMPISNQDRWPFNVFSWNVDSQQPTHPYLFENYPNNADGRPNSTQEWLARILVAPTITSVATATGNANGSTPMRSGNSVATWFDGSNFGYPDNKTAGTVDADDGRIGRQVRVRNGFATQDRSTSADDDRFNSYSVSHLGLLNGNSGTNVIDPPAIPEIPRVLYQAAFIRDQPTLWPRLLRVSYRIHSGRDAGDQGQLVTKVFPMPISK